MANAEAGEHGTGSLGARPSEQEVVPKSAVAIGKDRRLYAFLVFDLCFETRWNGRVSRSRDGQPLGGSIRRFVLIEPRCPAEAVRAGRAGTRSTDVPLHSTA